MFMNHIENMGWITSLVSTESGTDYNIVNHFGQVKIETIETDYQELEIATQITDNIKKLKFRGLYTWLFNSSTNRLKIYLPKKATIIIDPDLWTGSYLPLRFYAASDKEFVVHKT